MQYLYFILLQFGLIISCISSVTKNEIKSNTENAELLTDTSMGMDIMDTLSYIQGKFEPKDHPLFISVPIQYANREGMYLRKETLEAFISMAKAAVKQGIKFKIISATRNFNSQKIIWEDKWTGKTLVEDGKNLSKLNWTDEKIALKILEYSSMPSTSRHHWGTDIDINSLDNNYFKKGDGKKMYDWMLNHAHKYGFCQPYTAGRLNGYKEEKWHWTYMPISKSLTQYYDKNKKSISINGFIGAETAQKINIINHYVLGINQSCR